MKTEVGRNWYQSIHFYKLSRRQVSFSVLQYIDTITRGAKTLSAPLVHFDAILTGWDSKTCIS